MVTVLGMNPADNSDATRTRPLEIMKPQGEKTLRQPLKVRHFSAIIILVPLLVLSQGCLAAVWVAAVGMGTSVNGAVEFEAFQNSWLAPPEQRAASRPLRSIAVAPFSGDPAMANRFSAMFTKASSLRVITPREVSASPTVDTHVLVSLTAHTQDTSHIAQQIAKSVQADCVLLGTVVGEAISKSGWAGKKVTSKRLFLALLDAEGSIVWTDELPFTVTEGMQPVAEEWVQIALTDQVTSHMEQIGLIEIPLRKDRNQA